MRKTNRAVAILGAAFVVAGASQAQAGVNDPIGFFDWDTTTNPSTNFQPSPFLSDNPTDIAATIAGLNNAKAHNRPLAVKVNTTLTTNAAKKIFNDYAIQYVFADFEGTNAITQTKGLSSLVLNSTKSQNAYVGNFNAYPTSGDDTTRAPAYVTDAASFQNIPQTGQYAGIRAYKGSKGSNRMANEVLYPGSPDFRNPASGNSTAPNVRSALFTLPVIRAGFTSNYILNNYPAAEHKHIPWVSRFNNWGNNALDTDGNPNNGYEFVSNAANPVNGQLPSRGDFQAQILHYRLRGADSVNMFEADRGSVLGYTRADARNDIVAGWSNSSVVNGIFTRKNYAFANLGSLIGVTGGSSAGNTSSETAGAIWSGVYDKSGSNRKLAILISNLSESQYTVDLPNNIGGFKTVSGQPAPNEDDYIVSAGTHRLLAFTLQSGVWKLDSNSLVFTDSNRNGVGVPEPTTLSLLGMGAAGLLLRRRRQA